VQFVAIGASLFAIAPPSPGRSVISLRREMVNALLAADTSRSVAGTREREIEQRFVEDEILYREGLRLGFDKDDGIVRQRVIQKVLFLAEELGGASRPPTEAELRAFFDANRSRFVRPPRIRFVHVFAHQKESLPPAPSGETPIGGRVSPVGPEMNAELPQVEAALGAEFAVAVSELAPLSWSAPIRSAFGWHLVRVAERAGGRPATFEEARPGVIEQFTVWRRQEAIARYLGSAFRKYRVDIDGRPVTGFAASQRLAYRAVPSGED
jgi:hypothetical protein